MMRNQRVGRLRRLRVGMSMVCLLLCAGNGRADLPTAQERIRNSSMNPAYNSWDGEVARRVTAPEPEEGEPWPFACFRKDIELPAEPREARFTLHLQAIHGYWVFVNGTAVLEPLPARHSGYRNMDLTPHLRAGHNVLAVKARVADRSGLSILGEGIVFCKDGSTVRLKTDATWRGDFDLPEGWEQPDADMSKVRPLDTLGAPKGETYMGLRPPYYGPIRVEPVREASGRTVRMSQPIFDEEDPVWLAVRLMNVRKQGRTAMDPQEAGGEADLQLAFSIMHEDSRETVAQGIVGLAPAGDLDLAGRLEAGPLPKGAYRVRLVMSRAGEEAARRDIEIVSVGPTRQREVQGTHYEEGMDLRKVWSVDCTEEPRPRDFVTWRYRHDHDSVETVVASSEAGSYRTLAENTRYTAFGYRYTVDKLYAPHLLTVEWPDDAPRAMIVQAMEPTSMIPARYPYPRTWASSGFQRGDTSWFPHPDMPGPSNRMRKLRFIFWPNEAEGTVFIYNVQAEAPAAAARITISEITNDLPALKVVQGGDRLIGYHTERGPQSMSAAYYAGPLGAMFSAKFAGMDHPEFYRNWYTTTENMIKRMKFAGQNLYLMGHFMYGGVLYPSEHYIFSPNVYGAGDANRDYCGLILRMFERNGMKLISNVEYTNTREFLQDLPSEEDIRRGMPTCLAVDRRGKVKAGGWMTWLNFYHPEVRESVFTIVDELVDLYGEYPAWKGISFILSRWFGGPIQHCWYTVHDDPLDWGYGDTTMAAFEKDTGLVIPVDANDPERFAKRHAWLTANALEPWIEWRCEQFTSLYRRIRDRIVQGRPDLNLYLVQSEPALSYASRPTRQARELEGHYDDPGKVQAVLRRFGFDLELLKKEPGMVVNHSYATPTSNETWARSRRDHWDVMKSAEYQRAFAGDGKGGAYIWSGMFHAGYKFPKDAWMFTTSLTRQAYPMGRYPQATFVNVMVRSNPTWMPHTWMDVVDSGGRLHERRLFARAYRTLPNGHYERLIGGGRDRNLWLGRTKQEGREYVYAANTHWWPLDNVVLTFAEHVKVHDLILDRPVTLKDGTWAFTLGPYDVQTFRVTGVGPKDDTGVKAAEARVPSSVQDRLSTSVEKRLSEARALAARARRQAEDARHRPGWQRLADIESLVEAAAAAQAAGSVSHAYDLATSWRLEQACEELDTMALAAMPFLVLGPFGKPEDTMGSGKVRGNTEVVPDYSGMVTPYLGEGGDGDLGRLAEGFRPRIGETFTVYPGIERTWQKVLKGDYLSFYGVCHSEAPLWMVAYAYTEVYSPTRQKAELRAGSDHALWVWLNDRHVLKHGGAGTPRGGQRPAVKDQDRRTIELEEGWNRMLVKAVQRGETRIFIRITDQQGYTIEGLRFRVPPASENAG